MINKKSVIPVLAFVISLGLLGGCSSNSSSAKSSQDKNISLSSVDKTKSEIQIDSADNSVAYTTEIILNNKTVTLSKMNIVDMTSEADFAEIYSDIPSLYNNAAYAIKGTIKSVEYVTISGLPWTQIKVNVSETFNGSIPMDNEITIMQFGGYIALQDQIEYWNDKDKFSNMTESEINNTMLRITSYGEEYPIVGEENIYFLVTAGDASLPSGSYERLGSFMGEFNLDSNNNLSRYQPEEDFYVKNSNQLSGITTFGTNESVEPVVTISYDDFMKQLQALGAK